MLNEQVIHGNWTELRGRVKERWGNLTDDDLVMAEGHADALVGIIERRTGESREKIEHELDQMTCDYDSSAAKARRKASATVEHASETARQYADRASETARAQYDEMHQRYDEMSAQARMKFHEAENAVRRNPVESLAVAFGAGLFAGVVVGLCCRPGRD